MAAPEDAPAGDAADDAGDDAAEEAGAEDADDEDGLELHAAAVRARPATRLEVASRRYFMISPIFSYCRGAVR
jgi:hypothetical protein